MICYDVNQDGEEAEKKEEENDLEFWFHMDENGIYGIGKDSEDGEEYLYMGSYNRVTREVKFFKTDFKQENLTIFTGKGDEVNESFMMDGEWQKYQNEPFEITFGPWEAEGELIPGPVNELEEDQWQEWGKKLEVLSKWTGFFMEKGEKYNMQIDLLTCVAGDTALEGHGEDHIGKFVIQGEVVGYANKDVAIDFKKVYENGEPSVMYDGHIVSEEGNLLIKGLYKTENATTESEEFELKYSESSFEGTLEDVAIGLEEEIKFNGVFSTKGIFGVGKDDIGLFFIRGELDVDSRWFMYSQIYITPAKEVRIYVGRFSVHEYTIRMKGCWKDLDGKANNDKKIELMGKWGDFKEDDNQKFIDEYKERNPPIEPETPEPILLPHQNSIVVPQKMREVPRPAE